MRVALVCPYSLSVPGGVQNQVLGLARSLRALGHTARVLAPCDGPPPDRGVITVGRSVALAANGSVAPIAPDPISALRTLSALADERFDVLHLHEPLVPGPTLTSLLAGRVPTVGTFHAAGRSAAYRILNRLARAAARRLTLRCAVSEDARTMAGRQLGGQYVLLHNGIEIERFAKATPWPTEAPTIFFVGRHEPRKGLRVLLEALREVPAEVRLWVAGDGPETAGLRAGVLDPTVSGRVEWLGRISDHEVARRLRGADVVCAPSLRGESFGIVLLEAMAAQTPVVASDLPGYRNVVRAGRDGVLVEPGNPSALARAVSDVLSQPSLAASFVASGETRAIEFSMERLAERYVDLYAQAKPHPRRGRQGE